MNWRLCKIFGHKREYTPCKYWSRRRWQWRDGTQVQCVRCHASGDCCYEYGWLEAAWRRCLELRWKIEAFTADNRKPRNDDIPF